MISPGEAREATTPRPSSPPRRARSPKAGSPRGRTPRAIADTESEDAEGSEGDAAAGGSDGEPISEEDLTAAGDQAFEFVKAAATGEAETACSLAMDPTTGSGMSGSNLESCVAGFEESAEEAGTEFDPSVADALDRSMVETSDNGDGTAAVSLGGVDAGFAMVQGEDGKWYVDSAGLI